MLLADKYELRRENLKRLRKKLESIFFSIDENKDTKYTNLIFCETIGISTTVYNHLLNPAHRPKFTEVTAEKICLAAGLPEDWLDIDYKNVNEVMFKKRDFILFLKSYKSFCDKQYINFEKKDLYDKFLNNLYIYLGSNSLSTDEFKLSDETFFELLK